MNKVFLSGYVSRNPESGSSVRSGTAFSRASIAVMAQSGRGGQYTQYIDIVAFGENARIIESKFHQGDFVMIEGQLSRSRYVNKAGQNVYRTNVVVDHVVIPGSDEQLSGLVAPEHHDSNQEFGLAPNATSDDSHNFEVKNMHTSEESFGHKKSPFETSTFGHHMPTNETDDVGDVDWKEDMSTGIE